VNGHFDPRYESLVELFYALGAKQPAGGSSLAVYKDGKEVVNVWQGSATADSPWQQETISDVFSCTKGIISIIAARLIDQGFLDPNQRVSFYWPEFAAAGKADVTVATVLQHKAGLSAPRRDLTHEQALDRDFVIAELAGQEPLWAPGTIHGYHALTFGHLVSKLIESVTGLTAGQYLQKHIAGPLGADMWIGLPAEQLGRVATLISDGGFKSTNPAPGSDVYWVEKAMTFGGAFPPDPTLPGGFNDAETLAAELAGANGVTNARGLARIYSAAVTDTDGIRLVSDEALKAACVPASYGENAWHEIGPYPVWGNGFMLNSLRTATPGANGFGHDGLGGQAGWGNIEHRLGFGYTTTYLLSSAETQGNQQSLVAELNRILVG
jgi:CubicO group peptidase (beta-lactamase class C family)